MSENGQGEQGVPVDPQAVINQLMNRVAALTMELAVKDAYIQQLTNQKEANVDSDAIRQ